MVNGVELFGQPWVTVANGSGMLRGAALRSQNLQVPGVHGEQLNVLQTYSAGSVVLPLVVQGVDRATGDQVADGTAQLRDNIRHLTRLFYAPTVTVVHEWPDGQRVRAVGRLRSDPVEGERWVSTPPAAQINVALTIPTAFWEDVDPVVSATYALASDETVQLTEFADATAPMDALLITFGPGSNPYLYQEGTDSVLAFRNIIESGRELLVDTAEWDLTDGQNGTVWEPDLRDLRYFPRAKWFELDPTVTPGGPVIRLEHSGGDDAMTVQITARRKYQLGL